jgi:cytochrome c553
LLPIDDTMKRLLALALVACQPSMADPPPRPDRGRDRDRDTMQMHMRANFDLVRAIERLLIRGKLDDAKRFAAAIAVAPDEPAHGPWAARVAAVRERAAELSQATTLADGVRRVARLGAACGACHAEVTSDLAFADPPPVPPDKPTIEARMQRHRWAADRLWEGVVGNADLPWKEGLAVLSSSPLEEPADRVALAKQLKQIADRARRDKMDVTKRAVTYGEILQVCASCHVPVKETPR